MIYEVYTRIMVGLPLAPGALAEVMKGFHRSLGLDEAASLADVHAALHDAAPRHKRHEPDRERYERALEAYVDGLWSVDCAIAGVSEGEAHPTRCQLWVGVRVEQMEHTTRVDMPAQFVRPRPLKKGDLSMGSDLAHELGPDMHKEFRHAVAMFQRARVMIEGDAVTRTKGLPTSRQHDVGWAMLRWIVPVKG